MLEQQVVSNLSRRAALRIFGAAAGMQLVAACQASAPANPPTAAPVPKPTSPAAAAQPTAVAAPTTLPAVANDRAAQAGFIPVGVGPANTALLSAPKGQPHSGGTLRIGNLGDLPNADGHWINGQNVFYAADDRLVDLDASLQPHSSLAESWDNSADFTQITFHLRKGSRGTPAVSLRLKTSPGTTTASSRIARSTVASRRTSSCRLALSKHSTSTPSC